MSFWGGLANVLTGGIAGAVGKGLSAASEAKANNRGNKFEGQTDLERLLLLREQQNQAQQIAREQEGRAGTTDAYRKLISAQHLLTPGAQPQLAGKYSVAPRVASPTEMSGADALSQQVLARLQGGNPIAPVTQHPLAVDPNLLNAGKGESIMGWLGAALGGGQAARR